MPAPAPEAPFDDVQFVRRAKIADYADPGFFADEGATYDEIAAAIAAEEGTKPLSRARIAKIEREALRKLRRILAARGILKPDDVVP
jgi:hypothetical protein